ncbi:MAG: 30S ribosomal protein S6 [Candidatus Sericytochromatia bacterium]
MTLRKYEAVHVLHPQLAEEDLAATIAKFEETVKNLGGSVEKTERQGKKRIMFPVKKCNDGHFTLVHFSLPAEKVKDLRQYCKIAESTIRYFMVKVA